MQHWITAWIIWLSKNSADSCIPADLPGDPSWLLWYLYTFLWWCLGHSSSSHSHGAPWCLCLFEWHSVSNSCHTNDVISILEKFGIWNNSLCSLTWGLASLDKQSFNFYNFRKCILVHNGRESLHITGKTTGQDSYPHSYPSDYLSWTQNSAIHEMLSLNLALPYPALLSHPLHCSLLSSSE